MRFVLALLASLLALPALAAEPSGARAFVEGLYAQYDGAVEPDPDNRRFLGLFAPELRALLAEDYRRSAAANEVGAMDFDPFCACQDVEGMTHAVQSVDATAEGAAVAVENRWLFPDSDTRVRLVYRLQPAPGGGWAIADIAMPEMPSLRGYLQEALQ